ncbi:MAG: acetyltransferase [Rickettsiales bacterium]
MQEKTAVIIGGGGHTRVLIGMLQAGNIALRGIVTSNAALVGTSIFDVPVLGLEGEVTLDPVKDALINGVGNYVRRSGTGLAPRAQLYQRYRALGFDFMPVVSGIVQPHVIMGEGVQVMPGAVVQVGAVIGENVIINTRAAVDHDVVVSPHCHIAPGAVICGNVTLGEATHVGAGAVIIQGVTVGSNVVIGAGAIVTQHVPDGMVIRPAASERSKLLPVT